MRISSYLGKVGHLGLQIRANVIQNLPGFTACIHGYVDGKGTLGLVTYIKQTGRLVQHSRCGAPHKRGETTGTTPANIVMDIIHLLSAV